jgi:hypothetical protein
MAMSRKLIIEKEKKLIVVKELILEGKVIEFSDIFNYIDRKYIHVKTGMNYYRLLRLIKKPKDLNFEDIYNIAKVIKVEPRKIADLIFTQIDAGKKKAIPGGVRG